MTKRERKIPAKKKKKLGNNNNNKIHKVEKKKKKTYGVSCFEMIYAHRQLSKTKRKPVSL
jgi:hypothetical protein